MPTPPEKMPFFADLRAGAQGAPGVDRGAYLRPRKAPKFPVRVLITAPLPMKAPRLRTRRAYHAEAAGLEHRPRW